MRGQHLQVPERQSENLPIVWLILDVNSRIEPRQPQRLTHNKCERAEPAKARNMLQSPEIYDQRRRNPEGDDI